MGRSRLSLQRLPTDEVDASAIHPHRPTDTLDGDHRTPVAGIRWMRDIEVAGEPLAASIRKEFMDRALEIAEAGGVVFVSADAGDSSVGNRIQEAIGHRPRKSKCADVESDFPRRLDRYTYSGATCGWLFYPLKAFDEQAWRKLHRRVRTGKLFTNPPEVSEFAQTVDALDGIVLLGAERFPPDFEIAGRYRIRGFLGQGGYAVVYRAYDQKLRVSTSPWNTSARSAPPPTRSSVSSAKSDWCATSVAITSCRSTTSARMGRCLT